MKDEGDEVRVEVMVGGGGEVTEAASSFESSAIDATVPTKHVATVEIHLSARRFFDLYPEGTAKPKEHTNSLVHCVSG